jgi:hypothetical protein
MSHAGELKLSFTSPFIEAKHVRDVARFFTRRQVPVQVVATAVTESDLAGGAR